MLEDHVTIEAKMLKHIDKEISVTEDDAVKLIFNHIADDEKKHHRILRTILDRAFKIGSIP